MRRLRYRTHSISDSARRSAAPKAKTPAPAGKAGLPFWFTKSRPWNVFGKASGVLIDFEPTPMIYKFSEGVPKRRRCAGSDIIGNTLPQTRRAEAAAPKARSGRTGAKQNMYSVYGFGRTVVLLGQGRRGSRYSGSGIEGPQDIPDWMHRKAARCRCRCRCRPALVSLYHKWSAADPARPSDPAAEPALPSTYWFQRARGPKWRSLPFHRNCEGCHKESQSTHGSRSANVPKRSGPGPAAFTAGRVPVELGLHRSGTGVGAYTGLSALM